MVSEDAVAGNTRAKVSHTAKGIGENPFGPVAAAIANAVEDAVGVRIRDLPVTAEKLYRALKGR